MFLLLLTGFQPPSATVVSAEPFLHGTGTLRCLQKEMATYRYWSVSLWRDPDDVSHCRILSLDKTEWRLISATLRGWRRCFVADQLWLMTRIREEEEVSCHFLLQAPQCPCFVRKRFSRDHCCIGRSKPGCRIVGSHTRWELTTWADFQLCLRRLLMSTGCNSSHNGFLDVSRSNGVVVTRDKLCILFVVVISRHCMYECVWMLYMNASY